MGCPRCRKDLFTSIPCPQLLRQMREMRSNCMFPRAVRITFTWMPGELDPSITPPVIVQLVMEPPLAECCLGAGGFVVPHPRNHNSPANGHHYLCFCRRETRGSADAWEVTQQPRGRDRAQMANTGPFSSGPHHPLDKVTTESLTCHNLD